MIHCPTSMWELDHQEDWVQKNWCFPIVVLEKALESPFDSKKIKLVNPKGNQPWIMIGRTNAEAEAPIVWPPDAKEPTHWKRPCCWERLKATGEVGSRGWDGYWLHWLMDMSLRKLSEVDSQGQGSQECNSPWGRKESVTEWLSDWTTTGKCRICGSGRTCQHY